MHARSIPVVAALLAAGPLAGPAAGHEPPAHGAKHPTVADAGRFFTTRAVPPLPLPEEEDAFVFAIFGDRTGGPPEGVEVLAEAVREVNLIEPDLVMTVGDMIQGYNQTPGWIAEMREFKGIMDDLLCPWFPVAGNHDIYWRGPDKPEGEHERLYELHFGPLWYAFEHKGCWFIVLYSDEGDPETGRKSISDPATQRMSETQLAFLRDALELSRDAMHAFVFLHHPRWLGGNYGDDWEKVHDLLVEAGNVRAVFAGHIHRMRYDPRDGIEYVTLATTGGHQPGAAPEAGWLHHYHLVTVRPRQIALSALPVGEVLDVRAITGEVSDETGRLAQVRATVAAPLELRRDGAARGTLEATIENPVGRPIEVTLAPECDDVRWRFAPDHAHRVVAPGERWTFAFEARRAAGAIDETFRAPVLRQQIDYLAETARYALPASTRPLPLAVELAPPATPATDLALRLDGEDDHLRLESDLVRVPEGPLTLEAWCNADAYDGRRGLVAKTESSEFGLFVSNGRPAFAILVGESYLEPEPDEPILEAGRWHHVAGVYDGIEARLYVDGRLVASAKRSGLRRTNDLPLLVGADVDRHGRAVSHFDGRVDAVRLSTVARYEGASFEPRRRWPADDETVLLLNMDALLGPWAFDESAAAAHPLVQGAPTLEPVAP